MYRCVIDAQADTLSIYEERARWYAFHRFKLFISNVQGLDAQGTFHYGSFFVKGCTCSYTDAVTCMRVCMSNFENFDPRPPQVRPHNSPTPTQLTYGSLNPRGTAAKDGRVLVGDEILSIGERTNHARTAAAHLLVYACKKANQGVIGLR